VLFRSANVSGHDNTANGADTLYWNSGDVNTAIGSNALFNNSIGSSNIALGVRAGFNLTSGDNNIDIGNEGVADESNTIRIGTEGTQTRTFVAGVSGARVTGVPVKINSDGQLGTTPSSARFKQSISNMGDTSDVLFALRPVSFCYKPEVDPDGIQQFGLVAEEVEKINPALVVRDTAGKPYTVRYEAVNAMLLNEFLKEHKKVEQQQAIVEQLRSNAAEQEATISELKKDMGTLTAQLKQ